MNQNRLAQKRFAKKQKRKNKKYTGPKYSKLEQMLAVAPLLERAGIEIFQKPEVAYNYDKSDEGSTTTFV